MDFAAECLPVVVFLLIRVVLRVSMMFVSAQGKFSNFQDVTIISSIQGVKLPCLQW